MKTELPSSCWVGPTEAAKLAIETGYRIDRGDTGYLPIAWLTDEFASQLNKNIGATPAIVEAMQAGSIFGWHVPGANPASYQLQQMES